MKISRLIKLSFQSLKNNKIRALLTMLGIIVGIMSVIIINSVGAGAQSLIFNQVKKVGTNLVGVLPGQREGSEPPAAAFGISITTLKYEDAIALRDKNNVRNAIAATPYLRGTAVMTYQNKLHDSSFSGVSHEYLQVESAELETGSFFRIEDERSLQKVAILGSLVKEELFGSDNPINKSIRINKTNFKVIGILKPRGTAAFQNQDDQVLIPITVAQKIMLGVNHLALIRVKIDYPENIKASMEDVTRTLRIRHRIKDPADDDFFVGSQELFLSVLGSITNIIRYFLVTIGAVSLLVGGIGIMNIMYVSVNERTREIGLRKAIGVQNKDILRQFLLEAINLTIIAGIIGIVSGVVISYLVSQLAQTFGYDWDFVVSPIAVVTAVIFSAAIGISFGYYPAKKASQLEAIEALRYE